MLSLPRLKWIASILDPKIKLNSLDSFHTSYGFSNQENIDILKRYRDGTPAGNINWKNKPSTKLIILGEIARFRLWSQSEIALDRLESWAQKNDIDLEEWPLWTNSKGSSIPRSGYET